jgi:hypothetical protein
MKLNKEAEELTVRVLGFLKVDAKGRVAIKAVTAPLRLLFISMAAAILVMSSTYAKPEMVTTALEWALNRLHW